MHYYVVIYVVASLAGTPHFYMGCASAKDGFDLVDFNDGLAKDGQAGTVLNYFEADKREYDKCLKRTKGTNEQEKK